MLQVVVVSLLGVEVVGFMSLLEIRAMIPFTPVITQIFLEVVGRGKGSEVTTNQPSGTESSQFVPREGSLYKI